MSFQNILIELFFPLIITIHQITLGVYNNVSKSDGIVQDIGSKLNNLILFEL